jgi:2-phosphoglycerate kinase
MEFSRVIFIGGAPMIGKTTVAREIACRLQYDCISTDDIGAAIASVTNPASHPAFHYMGNRDFREYYIASQPNDLIRDINRQHEALWPALLSLFQNHSTWASAAIIEGWALRPEYVARLSGDISGLFLLADAALIEARIRSSEFSRGASDEEMMIQRYLERSLWYNTRIREQIADLGLKSVSISVNKTPSEIVSACLEELRKQPGRERA